MATATVHGNNTDNALDTTCTVNASANILVGSVLLVETFGDDTDTSSVTGIGTNSLTKLGGQLNTATQWCNIWHGILTQQINSGATVTVNWPSNSRPKGMRLISYAPTGGTNFVLDASNTNTGTGTAMTPGDAALASDPDGFAHVIYCTDSDTTQTTPTNYNAVSTPVLATFLEAASFNRILTSTSTENPSCTRGAGTIWWRSNIVVYAEVPAGGGAASLVWQPAYPSLYKR